MCGRPAPPFRRLRVVVGEGLAADLDEGVGLFGGAGPGVAVLAELGLHGVEGGHDDLARFLVERPVETDPSRPTARHGTGSCRTRRLSLPAPPSPSIASTTRRTRFRRSPGSSRRAAATKVASMGGELGGPFRRVRVRDHCRVRGARSARPRTQPRWPADRRVVPRGGPRRGRRHRSCGTAWRSRPPRFRTRRSATHATGRTHRPGTATRPRAGRARGGRGPSPPTGTRRTPNRRDHATDTTEGVRHPNPRKPRKTKKILA